MSSKVGLTWLCCQGIVIIVTVAVAVAAVVNMPVQPGRDIQTNEAEPVRNIYRQVSDKTTEETGDDGGKQESWADLSGFDVSGRKREGRAARGRDMCTSLEII